MTEVADIISGIRSSYQRSNIRDLNLDELIEVKPETRLGYVLQHLEPESQKDYAMNFDPVQNIFLDKLVSQTVLEKRIIIDGNDFFKGIIFLDYFTSVVCNDYGILDELYDIAKQLEQMDQFLDPDLNLIARYAGMHYLYHEGRKLTATTRGPRTRFNRRNKTVEVSYPNLKKVSPTYEAAARIALDLVDNEAIQHRLANLTHLSEIKAAIFTDALVGCLSNQNAIAGIMHKVAEGEYFQASMLAIDSMSHGVSRTSIQEYIQHMRQRRR